jgi:diguanylate cyclase (GGDEF)-like protein
VTERPTPRRTPLVLLASAHEWSFRALETVLAPSEYEIIRAHTGRDTLERARHLSPDVIIIDSDLQNPDALTLCHTLRGSHRITHSTPILLVTSSPTTRQQRIHAIRAGVSEYVSLPIDAEEFALRLESLVAAKRDADDDRVEGLVDPATGLYNARGLARRAFELGSHAYRHNGALACVVFSPEAASQTPGSAATTVEQIAKVVTAVQRASDATARLGPAELAILAPDTDGAGVVRLAERVARAVEQASVTHEPHRPPVRLRAGYYAVSNFRDASLEPARLLEHATTALHQATADPTGNWLRPFQTPKTPPQADRQA